MVESGVSMRMVVVLEVVDDGRTALWDGQLFLRVNVPHFGRVVMLVKCGVAVVKLLEVAGFECAMCQDRGVRRDEPRRPTHEHCHHTTIDLFLQSLLIRTLSGPSTGFTHGRFGLLMLSLSRFLELPANLAPCIYSKCFSDIYLLLDRTPH